MKFKFSNLAGRSGAGFFRGLLGLLVLPGTMMGVQLVYNNSGDINNANLPQVDAITFINSGDWNIFTSPDLYETADTLNYTNSGTMVGAPGWEFDLNPSSTGQRTNSANFVNNNTGSIEADDGVFFNPENARKLSTGSYLLISATNIVNKGALQATASGVMTLSGSGVDLSRGSLQITPIVGTGSPTSPTNFSPDTAIYDEFWVGGTNAFTQTGDPWSGSTVEVFTFFDAAFPCDAFGTVQIGPLFPSVYASYTNGFGAFMLILTNSSGQPENPITVYTNMVRQAVFALATDANITPSVRFGPAVSPTNIYLPMVAQFLSYSTNTVTGVLQPSTIYVDDNLAAIYTNGALAVDLNIYPSSPCTEPTYRPNSVIVARVDPGDYGAGSVGNGPYPLPGTFFYDPTTFSNYVALGRVDCYGALVDNLAAEPNYGTSITNAPGKIQIYANDLNLSKVRMRSESQIMVQADNLVASAGATMDCQNLSYNLGSTNGQLNITNLALSLVHRVNGTVEEWSALWTNYQINIFTNNWATNAAATNAPFFTNAPVTFVTEMDLAITVVDASGLITTVPVAVQDLILHSTNMVVSDSMIVQSNLLFDGQSLTILGSLTLSGILQNWTTSVAPTLRYFTNNGSLLVPNEAHFGDDGPTNYAAFVNSGDLTAASQWINAGVFQSGGSQSVSGGIFVTTVSGKVESGSIISGQSVQFNAGTLKMNNATMTAGDDFYFYVTGSLYDAGGSSGNVLNCNNGFSLPVKPATGDLLGTKLQTTTPVFAAVDHYWSALDRGATTLGYTNNEALGQFVLNEGMDSEFIFHATSASNALYADLLDLSQCPDFLDPDVLTIDPNFVIYYAAAKLPASFTIPPNSNGIPQEAEEYLNGQLGGHLVWVPSFAGPNSSVDVLIDGQTALVNKALRYSKIIDSNGNGIPNFYDPNPFDPVLMLAAALVPTNPPPAKTLAISWTATPNTVYQVQYSTTMFPANWSPLLSYTNSYPTNVSVTVWDTNGVTGQRYYRVSHP